jgi:hypothetical protein
MFFHIKKAACDFWGLIEDKFVLYFEENEKPEILPDGSQQKVLQFIEDKH